MIAFIQLGAGILFTTTAIWMVVRRSCAPLKRMHRDDLSPTGERRLVLVSAALFLFVGVVFFILSYHSLFRPDADDTLLGTAGIIVPAVLELFAIRHYNGSL